MMRKALVVVLLGGAAALRIDNKTKATKAVDDPHFIENKTAVAKLPFTQHDVDNERPKLEKMDAMLRSLLKSDTVTRSSIAPAIKLFTQNLDSVLNQTKSMNAADAMKKLLAAKAGAASLVADLSKHQESLMKEDFEQQEGLLLGVLMTHKADSMSNQRDIVKQADFAGLDVAKALLASNDTKTPLYVQAAQFLDTHKNAAGTIVKVDRKESLAASFDKRVQALEKDSEHRQALQKKRIEELKKLASKGGQDAKRIKMMLKHAEHEALKAAAQSKHDIETMKEAATAIRAGDVDALNRARAALTKSLEALKDKNAGMLVFLEEGSTLFEKDCPFCAAQCVEKCHNKGEPYVSCLTECADAGKSF